MDEGWMQNDKGIELTDINWVQAGANAPGREEKVELNLPEGINLERIKDKSLSQLWRVVKLSALLLRGPRHASSKTIPIESDCSLTTSKNGRDVLQRDRCLANRAYPGDEKIHTRQVSLGRP